MAVTVQQAACNALKVWLAAKLTDATVTQAWPDPQTPLPAKAITILRIGKPKRSEVYPEVVKTDAVVGDATHLLYTWRVAELEQDLQIDFWAQNDIALDDMIAQYDIAMHAGDDQTLGVIAANPTEHDLTLAIGDGYSDTVHGYRSIAVFSMGDPELVNTPDSILTSEYRAMSIGTLRCNFTMVTNSPRISGVTFPFTMNGLAYKPVPTAP